jgi:hypothetical protein
MRVLFVAAAVAAGYLYYMLHQENTDPIIRGAKHSARDLMAECIERKSQEYSTYDNFDYNFEQTCASENGLRYSNGDWR